MPKTTTAKKLQQAKAKRTTKRLGEFDLMVRASASADPLLLISEGDSWFDYPGYNLIDHVEKRLRAEKVKYKILRLEDNGDEAVAMLAREQRHRLCSLLKKYSNRIHVLFFDGGGNDLAGEWDLPFVLRDKPSGSATDFLSWIDRRRLGRRMKQIENAYIDLADLRDDYSPDTTIVTHTYDQAIPNGEPAKFVLGLFKTGPWLKPYLEHVPVEHHQDIIDYVLGQIEPIVQGLADSRERFVVAKTQGTLQRKEELWANELHPTRTGFEMLGDKVWAVVKKLPEVRKRVPD